MANKTAAGEVETACPVPGQTAVGAAEADFILSCELIKAAARHQVQTTGPDALLDPAMVPQLQVQLKTLSPGGGDTPGRPARAGGPRKPWGEPA
jgi:hypothetical protein